MDAQVQVQYNIGNTLIIPNDIRTFGKSFLSDNMQAAATSVPVDNTSDFSSNQLILMSVIGAENAEFIKVNSVSSAVLLDTTATLFTHNRGEVVQAIEYDQFVVEKSTTMNGSYTVLNTYFVQATQQYTQVYDNVGLQSNWYRVKLKNSVTGDVSGYTTPVSSGAFDPESVGATFNAIKQEFGISDADPIITTDFLLGALNSARNAVRDMMPGFKQSWLERFETPIQLIGGRNYSILPEDYDMKYNNGKLLSVRYPRINGLSPYPLTYIDKRQWNSTAYSLKYSYTVGTATTAKITYTGATGLFTGDTITGQASQTQATVTSDDGAGNLVLGLIPGTGTGSFTPTELIVGSPSTHTATVVTYSAPSTTLTVDNIGDFQPAGGTIFISGNTLLDTQIQEVTYTGIDLQTNTFTGCTGFIRDTIPGTQLFAFPTFSSATYYTCWFDDPTSKGWIVFNRPIPQVMHGRNIYIDYYAHMYPITNINDVLQEPFANAYNFYIKYAIKYRRDNSTDIQKDPDYIRFEQMIKNWIDNHYIGQGPTIITR